MNTAGAVILAIVLVLIAAAVWWVVYTRIRAKRLGLPPPPLKSYIPFLSSSSSSPSSLPSYSAPAPAPGGIVGWINDRVRLFRLRRNRNTRTAAGAYEGQSYNAGYSSTGRGNPGGGGGFGREEEDDDPWDARVGHVGYGPYEAEERELGFVEHGHGHGHGQRHGGGHGEGYQMNLAVGDGNDGNDVEERRGRTRSRSPEPGSSSGHGHGQQRVGARGNPFGDDAEPSNISLRGVSPKPMDTSFAGRKAAGGKEDGDRRSVFREEV